MRVRDSERIQLESISDQLSHTGLTVADCGTQASHLPPESECCVAFQMTNTISKPCSITIRLLSESVARWQDTIETLFGPHRIVQAGVQFQHDSASITVYNNGTLFVQSKHCVRWVERNFCMWRNAVYANQPQQSPNLSDDSIDLTTTITSTPLSHHDKDQSSTIRRALHTSIVHPKTPSAPPEELAYDGAPPLEPTAPPREATRPLTPTAPPCDGTPTTAPPNHDAPSLTPTAPPIESPKFATQQVIPDPKTIAIEVQTDAIGLDDIARERMSELENKVTSLNRQLSKCNTEKRELISQKDSIVREKIQLQAQIDSLTLQVSELEALAIAHDFPSTENTLSPAPSAHDPVSQPNTVSNHDEESQPNVESNPSQMSEPNISAINKWLDKQLPPFGTATVRKATKREKQNIWLSTQLPFMDETLGDQVSDNEAPPPLHDPQQPPIWFKLKSEYPELSNLFHAWVFVFGLWFRSREHAYQWRKAVYHGIDWLADRIYRTRSAKKVKSLADTYMRHLSEDWEERDKYDFMYEIQVAGLRDIPEFRETLLTSGLRPLREATDHPSWGYLRGGDNQLGRMYEDLRSQHAPAEDFQSRLDLLRDAPVADEVLQARVYSLKNDPVATPFIPESQPTHDEPLFRMTSHWSQPVPINPQAATQSTRLNPEAPSFHSPSEPAPMQTMMSFGDSNIQGVHPRIDNRICRTVPVPGGTVCPTPHKKHLLELLPTAMTGDESDIVLNGGTNDAATCDPVEFKNNYRQLVKTAASKGARVICSGIYHRGDRSTAAEVAALNTRIDILNEQIASVASEEGAIFVDNVKSVGSSVFKPNTSMLTAPQYLHLNARGRVDLSQRLAATITGAPSASPYPPPAHTLPPPSFGPPPSQHPGHPAPHAPTPLMNMNTAPTRRMTVNSQHPHLQSYAQFVHDYFRSGYPHGNQPQGNQ